MSPLDAIRPRIVNQTIRYPHQLYGHNQSTLKPLNAVVIDIMETVASMIQDPQVVGSNLENYIFEYTPEFNAEGERTFGNVTSAFWFKKTLANIRSKWGNDVNILVLNLSTDKTQVDRLQGQTVWPCYITIMNLIGKIRRTSKGSELIGYCPIVPYSKRKLKEKLQEQYGVLRDSDNVSRITKIHTEQAFIAAVVEPLKRIEETGPVLLRYGKGAASRVCKTMPLMMCFCCKFIFQNSF